MVCAMAAIGLQTIPRICLPPSQKAQIHVNALRPSLQFSVHHISQMFTLASTSVKTTRDFLQPMTSLATPVDAVFRNA